MEPFWKAGTWQDKLAFVHRPERAAALMKNFYEKQESHETRGRVLEICQLMRVDGFDFIHLGYGGDDPAQPVEVALRKESNGGYKLDWESYVGASEIGWTQFVTERAAKPALFRVHAQTEEYFNYEFSDEKKYVCARLESPDGKTVLYGYAEKGTDIASKLTSALAKQPKRATLTLKLVFPEHAQSKDCVVITEVLADRWFLLPSEGG